MAARYQNGDQRKQNGAKKQGFLPYFPAAEGLHLPTGINKDAGENKINKYRCNHSQGVQTIFQACRKILISCLYFFKQT